MRWTKTANYSTRTNDSKNGCTLWKKPSQRSKAHLKQQTRANDAEPKPNPNPNPIPRSNFHDKDQRCPDNNKNKKQFERNNAALQCRFTLSTRLSTMSALLFIQNYQLSNQSPIYALICQQSINCAFMHY